MLARVAAVLFISACGGGAPPPQDVPADVACSAPSFDVLASEIGRTGDPAEFRRRIARYVGCRVDWSLRGFGGEETSRPGASDPAPEPHLWRTRQRLISANIALGDLCTVDAAANPIVVALPLGHGSGFEGAERPNLVRVTGQIWDSEPEYANNVYLRAYAVTVISTDPVEEQRMCD